MLLKKEYEVKSLQTLGYVAKLKQHIKTPGSTVPVLIC